MRIFVLEDDAYRIMRFKKETIGHVVDFAQTVKEAKKLLEEHQYEMMFLDHDLGGEQMVASGPGTGYEVAQFIDENQIPAQCIIIHSCNHPGATAMHGLLPGAVRIPFINLNVEATVRLIASTLERSSDAVYPSQDGGVREI